MSVEFQASLFDASPAPSLASLATVRRTPLAGGAWVDVRPNWVSGADEILAALVDDVPWRAEQREMWDQVVDVPRLVHTFHEGDPLPHWALASAREALSDHYLPELGEPFATAGCCYYRDGRDSVAWHGDTIGRGRTQDTMVAIVSFGDPRRLTLRPRRETAATRNHTDTSDHAVELQGRQQHRPRRETAATPNHTDTSDHAVELQGRPRGGGSSISFTMGHGDLLVMGGSCQRTWEHAVPKTAAAGPRISVQFRPSGVF